MLNEVSQGFGVRKKDVIQLLSENDYIPPLGAPDYISRISLQLNLPDKIKGRALHSVKEIDSTSSTSPIIKACCAVILAAEEIGLQLATEKVASVTGVTTVALRQALLRFKG